MPRCIGGLSKMIDNQGMVDSVLSVDESWACVASRLTRRWHCWRSGPVLLRHCGMRRVARGFFVGAQSLLRLQGVLALSFESFDVSRSL
jgi:hypothetical protein